VKLSPSSRQCYISEDRFGVEAVALTPLFALSRRSRVSVLKNSLGVSFHPKAGTRRTVFGALGARFVAAISSMPTFSTGCRVFSEARGLM
jgi:hypothetical protein